MELRHIAVEGVPGAGKTVVAAALAQRVRFDTLFDIEDNPFLRDFQEDMGTQAFQAQLHFLLERIRQEDRVLQPGLFQDGVVADYLFDRDEIYASITLGESEKVLYQRLLAMLGERPAAPDLALYLQLSVPEAQRRCRALEPAFVKLLVDTYDEFFFSYTRSPLVVVKADDFNPDARPGELDELVRVIEAHTARGGTAASTIFFSPSSARS